MQGSQWRLLLAVAGAGLLIWPARAQDTLPGTVTGRGTAELKRQPELLRVQVEIFAKGKDIKEALARLRERKESARRNLESIGFPAVGIEFGDPSIGAEPNERRRQMQMMVLRQMRNQGKKGTAKPKEAPPVLVVAPLKAELRLTAASAEELLALAHGLEERIRAADLGGLRDIKQVTAQDEELAIEQPDEIADGTEVEGPRRGEPLFLYVSQVSEADQDKLLQQAFQSAKREATMLARAAGAGVGMLYRLEDGTVPGANFEETVALENPYVNRFVSQLLERARSNGSILEAREAIGMQVGKVSYRVVLAASFVLKPLAPR